MLNNTVDLLQIFAQGETGVSGEGNTSRTDAASGNTSGPSADSKGETTVIYGKVSAANTDAAVLTDTQNGESPSAGDSDSGDKDSEKGTVKSRREAYDKFIKENHDFYESDTKRLINRRFKEMKRLEDTLKSQSGIIDVLRERFGTDDNEQILSKLTEADSGLWRDAADDAGMSEEAYAELVRARIEANRLKEEKKQALERERARQFNERLYAEEAEMKKQLPDYDLAKELENSPDLARLLKSGVPLKAAYYALHFDEINANSVRLAQEQAIRATAENIRARGLRPSENGAGTNPAVVIKNDVGKLTRADRAEIARRAMLGENIEF